jgi:hypothetical protein
MDARIKDGHGTAQLSRLPENQAGGESYLISRILMNSRGIPHFTERGIQSGPRIVTSTSTPEDGAMFVAIALFIRSIF